MSHAEGYINKFGVVDNWWTAKKTRYEVLCNTTSRNDMKWLIKKLRNRKTIIFGEELQNLLFTNICKMENIVNILSSVINLSRILAIHNEIPCKMLAWLNPVGQAAVIKCHQVCVRQWIYITFWQCSAIGRPSQGRVKSRNTKV